ncbi:unnamed protein product [Acidithrix sp. C25]|nr:unnamed protein product [Acidithrix sp. C25]
MTPSKPMKIKINNASNPKNSYPKANCECLVITLLGKTSWQH